MCHPFTIPTVVFFLMLPVVVHSRPSAERPATQRYSLSESVFNRLLRAAHVAHRSNAPINLRAYFETQGVPFEPGCTATLNPSTRVLTVNNTTENRELIELIFEHVLRARINGPNPAVERTAPRATPAAPLRSGSGRATLRHRSPFGR